MANRKRNISFARPEEPDFIKKLKARAGITKGPDVETKKEMLEKAERSDYEDKDEEQPVVVVLKKGDLSEEEVKQISDKLKKKQEECDIKDGKITFKKPDKSQASDNPSVQSSANKIKNHTKETIKQKIDENNIKSVKNSSLLSFNEEEDEEYSD